jgi:hypothetical protein
VFFVGAVHDSAAWRSDTVVIATALPPAPEHVSVYVESAVMGPTLCDPLVASAPDHAPDAVQLVAFVLDHVSVVEPLAATPGGLADSDAVGAAVVTLTVALLAALPPVPLHVSVNVEFAVNAPVLCEPDVDFVPDHAPDAVQLVALVELHVNVDAEPDATLVGEALSVTVGAAATVTVAVCDTVPPLPVHASV